MGCGPSGAPQAQRALLETHIPRIKAILQQDRERTRTGTVEAARRLAPGFRVEDPERRERQMRRAMTLIRQPPRGIPEFIASPLSMIVAVGADGIVLCRNGSSENDTVKGQDFRERFAPVRRALDGQIAYELVEFGSGEQTSHSMLFAAPSRVDGEIVGAVAVSIPLWREAQRLSRQLRVELAPEIEAGMAIWVSMYQGERMYASPDAPQEIVSQVPTPEIMREGFGRSPGGFTGQEQLFHKWHGYAVIPLGAIGEGVGFVAYLSEPEPE